MCLCVEAELNEWTTVTATSDTSLQEIPRTAALNDDRLDGIEAFVISPGNARQIGNFSM